MAATADDAAEGRRASIEKKPIYVPDVEAGANEKEDEAEDQDGDEGGEDDGVDGAIGGDDQADIDKKKKSLMDYESSYTDKKDSKTPSAFARLPDEIIHQILQATDSNGFASLALLNSKWRSVAQQAHLYAYHLANCPSYALSHRKPPKADSEDDLPRLRRLFAKEVKRNLFEAYLRPNHTVIKIISNSISSSSCPGGEGIQFSASPRGHHLLGYNSSRIYVMDVRGSEIEVKREFKILRRPAATCINDQGSMLAVLLTEMQVDIYDLTETPPKRSQSMILDHSPRAIALSPCGSVLAAAYEGGIEVSSLTSALATDRRAVKCDAVDALTFSFDGTQILGTTVHSSQPNTVILTAPYYDPGSQMADDDISALWTTSILFPNTSRDCSHAVLIQDGKYEEAGWTFTYDKSFETFRAVRIDDLRNGTTYFTGPETTPASQAKLIPSTLPAASYYGELVSAGFQGKEIWLYGIPQDLDAAPDSLCAVSKSEGAEGLLRRNSGPSSRSAQRVQEQRAQEQRTQENGGNVKNSNSEAPRVPPWQSLCDNLRNTFLGGCRVGELENVSMVKWVGDFSESSIRERLIVAARGALPNAPITEDDGIDFVDGGRVTLMDFDYSIKDGTVTEVTIEVGTKEPEVLEEEHRDMDAEVAIVRRRTVAQKRASRGAAVMRAATTAARPPPLPTAPIPRPDDDEDDPLLPRRIGALPVVRRIDPPVAEEAETQSIDEQEALDDPYSHASPRSGSTLRRAATAAAANRRLHPAPAAAGPVEYRRADGRREHPHESDADNWVPPPPPYQKEDPGDLPAFLRHSAVPPIGGISAQPLAGGRQQTAAEKQAARASSATLHQQPRRSQTVAMNNNRHSSPIPPVPPLPSLSAIPPVPALPAGFPPGAMGSHIPPVPPLPLHLQQNSSRERLGSVSAQMRPSSRDSRYMEGDNIYDVSPPDSPALSAVRQRSREPSDSLPASSPAPSSLPPVSPPTATGSEFPIAAAPPPPVPPLEMLRPPPLDLQIPSPATAMAAPAMHTAPVGDPSVRRLSISRTWPTQTGQPAVAPPAGYPYSAPVMNNSGDVAAQQSFPPLPRPEQVASLGQRTDAPRRLSGTFQPPQIPHLMRNNSAEPTWRRTSYQRPISQQQHYSFPMSTPQPQQSPRMVETPLRRPHDMTPTPSEDMPLIISTPTGVSGAFDPPERRISGRRAETPILAPVPRHPRPQTQASILRPAAERLDTIFSIGSASGQGGSAAPSTTSRVPSISRKASRAERSAAKNIADAKKKGWVGRSKSRRHRKKKDFDAASSVAWTDVSGLEDRAAGDTTSIWGGRRRKVVEERVTAEREKGKASKCLVM